MTFSEIQNMVRVLDEAGIDMGGTKKLHLQFEYEEFKDMLLNFCNYALRWESSPSKIMTPENTRRVTFYADDWEVTLEELGKDEAQKEKGG